MATKKTTRAKASTQKPSTPKHIGLVKHDPYLEPYEDAICGRVLWSAQDRSLMGLP